jgi:uncharacterized protein (TIGR02246 family)
MVPSDVPSADRVAIGQAATAFVDAWNAHDSHAFALTFVPDGDFANVLGVHVRGRQASTPFMRGSSRQSSRPRTKRCKSEARVPSYAVFAN